MPIVDVQVFGEMDARDGTCVALARAIGDALGVFEGELWLWLSHRPAHDYAENGPTPSPLPVFVRVLA